MQQWQGPNLIQQNLNGSQRLSEILKNLKGHILYNFIYITFQKRQNYDMKNRLMVAKEKGWWEEQGVCVTTKQHEGALCDAGTVLYVVCGGGY